MHQTVRLFCLLFCYSLSTIVLAIMSTRQTNNSLPAALHSTVVSSAPASNAASSTPSSRVVSSQPGKPVVVSSPIASTRATANSQLATSSTVLSSELVAVINQAVQVVVKASQRQQETATVFSTSSSGASSSPSLLGSLASSFLAAGTGFQPAISSSSTSGRTIPLVVPTFVSTFDALVPGHVLSGVSAQLPSSLVSSVADQPFIVGLGFSPVPATLVSQILSGKFVDLSELLSANLVNSEPEPQLMLDGRLVLSAPLKKPHRRIEDMTTWTEAFTVFSLVLTSSFPHHWKDLTLYKLFILQIHHQFSGRVWLTYDKAFCEHAAATQLVDWSAMNAQLFNFHASGASFTAPISACPRTPLGFRACTLSEVNKANICP